MIKKPPDINLLNQFFIIFSGLFNQWMQKLDVNREQLLISGGKSLFKSHKIFLLDNLFSSSIFLLKSILDTFWEEKFFSTSSANSPGPDPRSIHSPFFWGFNSLIN